MEDKANQSSHFLPLLTIEKLKRHLKEFEKNKEWADLVNWLTSLNQHLRSYKITQIPNEEVLAKRLAQCLNQSLPSSVHSLALETYSIILELICEQPSKEELPVTWGNRVAYYTPGLLSFYQFAKLEIKLKFNEIIKKYYLRMGREMLTCLNALVAVMLLGLDDQSEDAVKSIEEILAVLEKKVGTRAFYSAVWLAIFRTSKVRYPAFKFISKNIPDSPSKAVARKIYVSQTEYLITNYDGAPVNNITIMPLPEDIKEVPLEIFVHSYYPHKSSLVLNAIGQSIEDENRLTQRTAFDFLITHIPLKSPILKEHEKIILVEACIYSLLKKNESIIRRFYTWTLGELKGEDSIKITASTVQFQILTSAFKKTMCHVPDNKKAALAPMMILKMIYDDNETLADMLLQEQAIEILTYLEKHKERKEFGPELVKYCVGLLDSETQLAIIWNALVNELSKLVIEANTAKTLEVIQLIKSFLIMFNATQEDFTGRNSYLSPIFVKVMTSIGSLSEGCKSLGNILPGLQLVQDILSAFNNETMNDTKEFNEGVHKFVAFFKELIISIINGTTEINGESEEAFSRATKLMVKLQRYMDFIDVEWLEKIVECILAPSMQSSIVQICIEVILQIWENSAKAVPPYPSLHHSIKNEHEIVSRLWNMVGMSPNDRNVIEQIIRVECTCSSALSSCVLSELSDPVVVNRLAAINRFSLFWKLSAEYFPIYEPLQSEPCLLQMIDSLSHDHPLIRHASKSWLVESTRRLDRVLDPILKSLLKTKGELSSPTKPTSLTPIIDGCKRLRAIIISNTMDLLSFLTSTFINDELFNLYLKDPSKSAFDLLKESKTYLELLLFLSLKYISAQVLNEKQSQGSETASINACGCELLELILLNLEPSPTIPLMVGAIIEPLLSRLSNAFREKDTVLQVEILKLIRIIQSKNVRGSMEYAKKMESLLGADSFTEMLKKGLGSPVSYVRSYYISYVGSSLGLFVCFLGEKFEQIISQLFAILCNSLALCSAVPSIKSLEGSYISNQNDIMQVINGMKTLLFFCFFEIEEELQKAEVVEYKKVLGQYKNKKRKACLEDMRKAILSATGGLIISFRKLWRIHVSRLEKDYMFSSKGVLPISEENYLTTFNSLEAHAFSFIEIEMEMSIYQKAIISLLQPLMHTCGKEILQSVINVWINERRRGNNEILTIILDMLILLRIPIEDLIDSISTFIETDPLYKKKNTSPTKGKTIKVKPELAQLDASICLLLYTFIVHTYDYYENKEFIDTYKMKNLISIWSNLCKLVKTLVNNNKYPSTMCWLFDIIHALSIKCNPKKLIEKNRKVKSNIEGAMELLATNIAKLATDQIGIITSKKFTLDFPLNPTMFELVEKTELTSVELKNSPTESEKRDLKIRKLFRHIYRMVDKPTTEGSSIAGRTCGYYLKGYCFLTMRALLYSTTDKLLGRKDKDKMEQVQLNVTNALFAAITDKENLYQEYAADVLVSMLRTKEEYMAFRKVLLDTFRSDNFFTLCKQSVKQWRRIFHWLLKFEGSKLLDEFLGQLSLSALTLLQSKATEQARKYIALKRLSFLILAGELDYFDEYYQKLINKVVEGITDTDSSVNLVSQYLNLLKVMFLRFSKLNKPGSEERLQAFWPIVQCKLIQIFMEQKELKLEERLWLLLDSLRLLEVISVLNVVDHTLFQWLFIVDSFGLRIISNDVLEDEPSSAEEKPFVPLGISLLPTKFTATFMNESTPATVSGTIVGSLGANIESSILVFTKRATNMMEIAQAIISYLCYLSMRNSTKIKLDIASIEDQIEKELVSSKFELR